MAVKPRSFQVDQLTHNSPFSKPNGQPTAEFIQQWNLLLGIVKGVKLDSELIAQLAAVGIDTTAPITGGGPLLELQPIGHADSGVTPGAYTSANITVDADGHVTAASNGAGGSSNRIWGASGGYANNNGVQNRATKGSLLQPYAPITVNAVWNGINGTIGQTLVCRIYEQAGITGTIGTLIATSSVVAITATRIVATRFDFPTAPVLAAGNTYLVAISITSGTGTTSAPITEAQVSSGGPWNINGPGINLPDYFEYNVINPAPGTAPTAAFTTRLAFWIEGVA